MIISTTDDTVTWEQAVRIHSVSNFLAAYLFTKVIIIISLPKVANLSSVL